MNNTKHARRFSLLIFAAFFCVGAYIEGTGLFNSAGISTTANVNGSNSFSKRNDIRNLPVRTTEDFSLLESRRIAALTKTLQRGRDVGLSLNGPMAFYGRVVDQYNQPVSGVVVTISYAYYSAVVLADFDPHRTVEKRVTNSNGEFSFTGKDGITLSVELDPMPGFRYGRNHWSQSFQTRNQVALNESLTSRDKPYIFHAYRLGKTAKLMTRSARELLEPDRSLYSLSFNRGNLTRDLDGDLQISVSQSKDAVYRGSSSWSVELKGLRAVFQETDDQILFMAPTAGYIPAWSFSWSSNDKNYSVNRVFRFWVKRGDCYGNLKIELDAFYKGKIRAEFSCSMNTEHDDPNLQPVLIDWPPKETSISK